MVDPDPTRLTPKGPSSNRRTLKIFFSIGFRPFYTGAAAFACLAIPLWAYAWHTGAALDLPLPIHAWHIHEMLFGFAPAVIVGFLLTAVRNWTGHATASGVTLAGLFGIWVAGRLTMLTGPYELAVLIDLAFLPLSAACLLPPLLAARNFRNLFVIAVLLVMLLANVAFHGVYLKWFPATLQAGATTTALNVILLLIIIMAGRVIPAFSANAIPSFRPVRWPGLDALAIGVVGLIVAIDVLGPMFGSAASRAYTLLLYAAAVLHLLRPVSWQPWKTWRDPLLLVLPLSYLWIPGHLFLRAMLGGTPAAIPSLATHALVVGGMAGMMLSMMTRSALGHTGRTLKARLPELVCFAAIHSGALVRVIGPITRGDLTDVWLSIATALWTVAFATFLIAYVPILIGPRLTTEHKA